MSHSSPHPFVFDTDYEPVEPPPVLFHAIRVPCACGRALSDCLYTFFPSSIFVHGVCVVCGPRSAIFAPHLERTALEPMSERVKRSMRRLLVDLARVYGTNEQMVIDEFLTFIANAETPVMKKESGE